MNARWALIIANTDYADPKLAKLSAPSKDAEAFAEILRAPDLAAFSEVTTVINQPESVARRAMAKFFVDRRADDLLLLYFSGHGIRDDQGRLFLAMADTDSSMLDATAVPADFVTRQMDNSRSRRQVLILDCCNSGAFASGTKAATQTSMGTGGAFEGTGYGRAVLTATDATQFAWEGDKIIGEETTNSLFTHFLVKGLEGEADGNGDGIITVDELYDYTYSEIVKRTPKQTPGKWTYREQGQLVLTTQVRPHTIKPIPLDPDLEQDLQSTRNYIREAAVSELGTVLSGPNLGRALSAELRLKYIAENDDSRTIAQKASRLLEQHRASRGTTAAIEASTAPAMEAKRQESNIEPAPYSRPLLPVPDRRRNLIIAAIALVVLGLTGLVWRALLAVPAVTPVASQSSQELVSAASKPPSTELGFGSGATVHSSPQQGTWSIDYFPNVELNGPAVFHTEVPAEQNPGGGYTLQIKSGDLHNNPKVPLSNLSMLMSGLFYFSGGTYDFHCEHQDGCRVSVDGANWIDAWWDGSGGHDMEREIPAGNHKVTVQFYDKSGQGLLQVFWRIKPQITPSATVTEIATSTPTKLPAATPTTRPKKDKEGGGPSICLAFGTQIETPRGLVPVQDLRTGELVWTQDSAGGRIAMPITRTGEAAVPANTELLHLILSDGREVRVSAGHPTAEGRPVGELKPGDWLDGAQVTRVERFPYGYAHTYDILPAGTTGTYWADGILLGSTLK